MNKENMMSEAELKLVELDPNKQYVVMFKGDPSTFKWTDKPKNVSNILVNADHYSIEDIDKVKADLGQPKTQQEIDDDQELDEMEARVW